MFFTVAGSENSAAVAHGGVQRHSTQAQSVVVYEDH